MRIPNNITKEINFCYLPTPSWTIRRRKKCRGVSLHNKTPSLWALFYPPECHLMINCLYKYTLNTVRSYFLVLSQLIWNHILGLEMKFTSAVLVFLDSPFSLTLSDLDVSNGKTRRRITVENQGCSGGSRPTGEKEGQPAVMQAEKHDEHDEHDEIWRI